MSAWNGYQLWLLIMRLKGACELLARTWVSFPLWSQHTKRRRRGGITARMVPAGNIVNPPDANANKHGSIYPSLGISQLGSRMVHGNPARNRVTSARGTCSGAPAPRFMGQQRNQGVEVLTHRLTSLTSN